MLTRALWALAGCYIAGLILGMIGEMIVAQHIALYAKKNPIPEVIPLPKEPVLIAELAEDQSVPHVEPSGAPVAQIAQTAQSTAGNRKAA